MKTKKAAAGARTAAGNKLHRIAYPKIESLTSWKMLVGGLLLFGDKKKKVFWPFFDAMLRHYEDLRLVSQSGPEQPGATNGGQKVGG
jgi:hypothetical protein